MRTTSLLAGVLILPLTCFGQSAPAPVAIKVQIDANEWNRPKLLEKLNQQGTKHGMRFSLAEEGKEYDYRIAFATGKPPRDFFYHGTVGTTDYDIGFATVYGPQRKELFQIKEEGWTEMRAINGTAKEIVKRLKVLRGGPPPKKEAPR